MRTCIHMNATSFARTYACTNTHTYSHAPRHGFAFKFLSCVNVYTSGRAQVNGLWFRHLRYYTDTWNCTNSWFWGNSKLAKWLNHFLSFKILFYRIWLIELLAFLFGFFVVVVVLFSRKIRCRNFGMFIDIDSFYFARLLSQYFDTFLCYCWSFFAARCLFFSFALFTRFFFTRFSLISLINHNK